MNASVLRIVIGALIGAGVGFAIYKFIGCRTGTCPLSANPWIAMALWGFVGAMVASSK